jgi:hypothetical protein
MHTAARFGHLPGLKIVFGLDSLKLQMSQLLAAPMPTGEGISDQAAPELIAGVAAFLDTARTRH